MSDELWAILESLTKRVDKLEELVNIAVPKYVAPMDVEVRKLIEAVDDLKRAVYNNEE
jgi:hypothetical protein